MSEPKHQIFSAKRMVWRRKSLRQKSTNSEKLLWERLRRNSLGYKFKRQFSVENYVVDFYCPDFKLAIELDGSSHKDKKIYDEYRTKFLSWYDIKEIRFKNYDIVNNMDVVINKIKTNLTPLLSLRRPKGEASQRLVRGELKGRG